MPMFEVMNKAQGPRIFHTKPLIDGDEPTAVILAPGEARTMDVVNPDHPVLKAWVAEGTVTFGEPKDPPEPPPPGRTPMIEPQSAKPTKS